MPEQLPTGSPGWRVPQQLDLNGNIVDLTAALVDVPSESRHEAHLADLVEAALTDLPHLEVTRHSNTVVARTHLGHSNRVVLAGHLDTVPAAGNLPSQRIGSNLFGLGSCDMKGGVAVGLRCAAQVQEPKRDVTYVFYEAEEIDAKHNGLKLLSEHAPHLLEADFAVLMEPTDGQVEAGCQGTLRVEVGVTGKRAHSARAWKGDNAIHRATEILNRLRNYEPRRVEIDGLEYREGLNAVGIRGGVAGNVIPDEAVVTVNYRFAPDLSVEAAQEHLAEVFRGFSIEVVDAAGGALPGLDQLAARQFLAATETEANPKFGWTDVARFSDLGVPAVNFGPGDPSLAHTAGEFVPIPQLQACETAMLSWLAKDS